MLPHNLRHTDSDTLQPVAPPKIIAHGAVRPLVEKFTDQSLIVSLDDGYTLALLTPSTGETVELHDFPDEIKCAVASDSHITAMTASGGADLAPINVDGIEKWRNMDSRLWPQLSLSAVELADCTSTVPPRELSSSYTDLGKALEDVDRNAVTADLRRAYYDIVSQANAQGAGCSTMVARYRLIGHHGETLYQSAPLLVGPSDTSALTAPIFITSADRCRLDSYDVTAKAWRLRLKSLCAVTPEMAAAVSRIEILAAPQFHPYDPMDNAYISLIRPSSTKIMMRVVRPGARRSVSSGNAKVGEARLRQILAVFPALERVVGVIQGPFAAGETLDIQPSLQLSPGAVADECRTVERAIAATPKVVDEVVSRLSWPHIFSAECAAKAVDCLLWSGLHSWRYGGYGVETFGVPDGGLSPWHAFVAVKFSNGECVVNVSQGARDAPELFNPVLSYPSPDATEMTIGVSSGGIVRCITVPLTPDPSGAMSLYVHPTFAPFRLPEIIDSFVVPPEIRFARPMPGYVALTRSDAPLCALAVAPVCDAPVHALFAATRSQSSWDFAKVRFTALSRAGVYTITVSSGATPRISVSLIDSRSSPGPNAAIRAGDRLLAILDNTLTQIGITKTKDITLSDPSDSSDQTNCALDQTRKELWLSPGVGGSTVVRLTDLSVYTRDESVTGSALGSYAIIDGNLCDLTRDRAVDSVFVRWSDQINLSSRHVRLRALTFDIRSPQISYGELTVSRMSHNDVEPSPSLRMTFNGAVLSPVTIPLAALPLRALTFTFQSRLHPHSTLKPITPLKSLKTLMTLKTL